MNVLWQPQEGQQTKFLESPVYEILYGGAAGGGKSDALLMGGLEQIHKPNYKAIIFRKTFPQLTELKERANNIFPKLGGKFNDSKNTWTFPIGSKFIFSHMEHEKDKLAHDGKQYQYIGFDELTHFSETQYLYMHSRCRTADPSVKCYVRASAMPLGVGIAWVKQRFIDLEPEKVYTDPDTGLKRLFIPAKLEDNKILLEGDPTYTNKLKLLGDKLYQALRHGDWDVIEGAAFDELDRDVHMVEPHLPPKGSFIWRSMDWGYSKPFSIGWYYKDFDNRIIRFHEWYGCTSKADTGLKMDSREVARGVLEYDEYLNSQGLSVSYGVADPACWSKIDNTPSIIENMRDENVLWEQAINDRIQGKMEFHSRLRVNEGRTGLMVTSDCKHWWRTIPVIQVDEKRPEDVNTKMEDHIYDETRYSIMSQPCLTGNARISFGSNTVTSEQEW